MRREREECWEGVLVTAMMNDEEDDDTTILQEENNTWGLARCGGESSVSSGDETMSKYDEAC